MIVAITLGLLWSGLKDPDPRPLWESFWLVAGRRLGRPVQLFAMIGWPPGLKSAAAYLGRSVGFSFQAGAGHRLLVAFACFVLVQLVEP